MIYVRMRFDPYEGKVQQNFLNELELTGYTV